MAEKDRTFSELLQDSPKAQAPDVVSIVGLLEKSENPEKFVLIVGDGSAHTLDVSAVRKHAVLGHCIGHVLVQLDIARKDLSGVSAHQLPLSSYKLPILDMPQQVSFTLPTRDSAPTIDVIATIGFENIWGPEIPVEPAAGVAPFSLGTGHQVAQAQLEVLNNSALRGPHTYLTQYVWTADHIYLPQTHYAPQAV